MPALFCRYVSLYSPPASLESQRTQRIIIFPLPLTPLDAGQGRRQWKSTQQLTLRKRQKALILWLQGANTGILLPEGLCHFTFRVLRPGDSGAYPSGSAKSKKEKPKTLRSLRLCGEQFLLKTLLWTDTISQTKPTPCCRETPHPVQYTHPLFVPESSRFHFSPQRAASAA